MLKLFKEYNTKHLVILGIVFLLAVFTRFYQIEKIPGFIAHDELGYLLNAQALNASGSDITGTWNPFSLVPVTPTLAELTTQLIFPFYKLSINQVLSGKLLFIIFSLIVPFLIAGISYQFTKSKNIALWTWVISLFNPWIWQQGRMSFDPYASFFFYVLGAYLLLRLKNWKKLWAILPLFIGFYQYQGHKLIFLFWTFFFFLYSISPYLKLTTNIKKIITEFPLKKVFPQIAVLLFTILLFGFYTLIQLPHHKSGDRLNSLYTPDSPEIRAEVNELRRLSLDSTWNEKFINKYSIWAGHVFKRFTETYSFEFLFLEGQVENSVWSVWNHGIFYIADSVLIILGLVYLVIKKRYKFLALLGFGLSTFVITSLISANRAYYFRSSLNIPLLIILAGIGMEYLKSILPKKLFYIFILVYLAGIIHFTYLYFIRYPVIAADRQFFSDRIVAEYLRRLPSEQKIVLFSPEPEFSISTYIFFNNLINKNSISSIQSAYANQDYKINNIQFIGDCLPQNVSQAQETVISRHDIRNCEPEENNTLTINPETEEQLHFNPLEIQAIKDGGAYFHIYNDQLCSGLEINPYLQVRSLDSFDFKNMSNTEFCQTWLSKLIEQ